MDKTVIERAQRMQRNLAQVEAKYEKAFTSFGQVNISFMAKDARITIQELLDYINELEISNIYRDAGLTRIK